MTTEEKWRKHKEKWEASQQSLRGYCLEQKLRYDQCRYHLKKITDSKKGATKVKKELFIPITVTKKEESITEIYCTVEYPVGIKLIIQSKEVLGMLPKLIK